MKEETGRLLEKAQRALRAAETLMRAGDAGFASGRACYAMFLVEVEGVVLETLLERIFGVAGNRLSAVAGPGRFHVLWRCTYKTARQAALKKLVANWRGLIDRRLALGPLFGAMEHS